MDIPGTMYFDTTDDKLKLYNGTSFVDVSYAGEVRDAYSGTYGTAGGTKLRNIFPKRNVRRTAT